jgi:hypothetical protein
MMMLVRSLVIAAFAATAVVLCKTGPEIRNEGEAGVVLHLPERVGSFIGEKKEPDPMELKILPSDTQFARMVYHTIGADAGHTDIVQTGIVLSGVDRNSIHRPEVCLVAQGWTLVNSRVIPVTMEDGRSLRVRDLQIKKTLTLPPGNEPREIRGHYVYWYVGTDVSTPDHTQRIWTALRDSIFRNLNHRWAYPSAMALVTEGFTPDEIGQRARNDEQTVAMLVQLIHDLVPQFQKDFMAPNLLAKKS